MDEHANTPTIDLPAQARRAAIHLIKMRARHYARRPQGLDCLLPGLSMSSPETLIAVAEHLVDRESRSPRRWFGFGGEVNLVNARAALLLGRTNRLAASKIIHLSSATNRAHVCHREPL
jgi:hypothetical protein